MGCLQAEEPLLGKECVRPAFVVRDAFRDASALRPLAQKTAQSTSEPSIFIFKDVREGAVFEVLEPASKRLIRLLNDARQTLARCPFGDLTKRVSQLLTALVSRPVIGPTKRVAQK